MANNEAINTVIANQQTLANDAKHCLLKQAELKSAVESCCGKATAEGEKNSLLAQRQHRQLKGSEAQEAAYKAQQAAQRNKL